MKKTCAAFLSLSLSFFAALTPATQAAQFAAESSPIHAIALPAVSLTPALAANPGLAPSSISTPDLPQTTGLVPSAAEAVQALALPQAPAPLAARIAIPAAQPGAAHGPAASAENALEHVGRALSADSARNPEGTLNPLFENTGKHEDCAGSCGSLMERIDDVPPATLQPSSVHPESNLTGRGAPQGPKSSFARSAKVGFIGGVTMLALDLVTNLVAALARYHFHPGYQDPTPQHPTLGIALAALSMLSLFAPVAEEVLFRYGLMGIFRKLTFGKSKFIVPAVASSLIFTALHELRDPVLFGVRFVGAMILARIYHKEGIGASMATHAVNNGLPYLPVIVALAVSPLVGNLFAIALVPAALYLAWKFHKQLKAEAPARQAGKIVPFQITRGMAFSLAFLLALGFLFVLPTPVWVAGLLAWLIYARRHKTAKN